MKCTARRTNGEPCNNWAIHGATVCRNHGGSAPQVKRAARERLLAAADPAAAELARLAAHAESESVRLAAIRDLLDRAGYGAKHMVEQTLTVQGDGETDASIRRLLDEMAAATQGGAAVAPAGTSAADGT